MKRTPITRRTSQCMPAGEQPRGEGGQGLCPLTAPTGFPEAALKPGAGTLGALCLAIRLLGPVCTQKSLLLGRSVGSAPSVTPDSPSGWGKGPLSLPSSGPGAVPGICPTHQKELVTLDEHLGAYRVNRAAKIALTERLLSDSLKRVCL